jgi:transcriptional regulator with XRE-family HTH domain
VSVVASRNLDHGALRLFAEELRRARANGGLSQEQLGDEIGYSGSLIGMVETGRRPPSLDFAERCDGVLGTGGLLARVHEHVVARESYESWFREWVEIERETSSLRTWEPMIVPGLLQTAEYARAVLRAGRPNDTDEQVEQHVSARMERQAILAGEDAPFLWAVVDEVALLRPVGEAKVMHGQLARMIEAARNPRIKILVVPLSVGAHAGLAGHFVIAEFDSAPDIVYLETAAKGQISDQPDIVKACTLAFDTLRAEALGPKASLELISKVMETWS